MSPAIFIRQAALIVSLAFSLLTTGWASTPPLSASLSVAGTAPHTAVATATVISDTSGRQILSSIDATPTAPKPVAVAPAERTRVSNTLSKLPLSFEPNHGQSAGEVRFLTRAPGYLLQLTATEMRMLIKGPVHARATVEMDALHPNKPAKPTGLSHALRFTWRNANPDAGSQGEALLPGTVNYLKGSDATKYHTAIPTYERVRFSEIYPGIDLVYYGNGRQIEYDLIVQPGADPEPIAMTVEGADATLADNGDLTLTLSDGRPLTLEAPVIYQEQGGERLPVEGRYRLAQTDTASDVRFEIGAYDPSLPLTIDPLIYSTFLGGTNEEVGFGIAVNAANEAFVTGYTIAAFTDFPTTAGAFDITHNGDLDAFVTRLNAAGSALLYSTFLGGSGGDLGQGIAVNAAGEAFVTGVTLDDVTDFPTTAGAFEITQNGGQDVFVTRLNAAGSGLLYSTLLGGSSNDLGLGIALNAANEAFVTGYTEDAVTDFPTTAGAFDITHNGTQDVFVARLNAAGSALVYSTFLGGSGFDYNRPHGIAVNAANEAFVIGVTEDSFTDFPTTAGAFDITHNGNLDAFVTRLNAAGSGLLYSTFLGGSGEDEGRGIAVNAANEAFVTGETDDAVTDFPTTAQAFDTTHNGFTDAFVTRLNAAGSALVYSTFLGGGGFLDSGRGIAVNAANEAFVTGSTENDSTNFPTTAGAFDITHNGVLDAFVTRLNAAGTALLYSTFVGGSGGDFGEDIAVNASNQAFVTGYTTNGTNFPTTAGAFDTTYNGSSDAFVAKVGTDSETIFLDGFE